MRANLTDEQIAKIIHDYKNNVPISHILRKMKIGDERFRKIVGLPPTKKTNENKDLHTEEQARKYTAAAKAYWGKFQTGHIVTWKITDGQKKYVKHGKIVAKYHDFMLLAQNGRRYTIRFSDVVSKRAKIRHHNLMVLVV